jgi:hypothetical protein
MRITIAIEDGRLAASIEETRKHEPRELLAATPVDVRAADQISALISKLVGISVYDAIVREAGGGDGG